MTPWHEDERFWATFGPALDDPDPDRAAAEAAGLVDLARLPDGGRVLDVGCGHGRHALSLARLGYAVTALDLSARRLRRVRDVAEAEGLEVEILRRDMRTFSRPRHFHGILWAGDAVGLFDREEERDVVQRLLKALKPGGRLVVAPRSKELQARRFVPQAWRWLDGETLILEERQIDDGFGWMRVRFSRVRAERQDAAEAAWRLFSGAELEAVLRAAGFDRIRLFGGFRRIRYDLSAERLVAVAER
jgi:SAM-dependent methyltransferase